MGEPPTRLRHQVRFPNFSKSVFFSAMDSASAAPKAAFSFHRAADWSKREPWRRPPSSAVRSSESRHFQKNPLTPTPPECRIQDSLLPPLEPSTRRTSSAFGPLTFKPRSRIDCNCRVQHAQTPLALAKNAHQIRASIRSRRYCSPAGAAGVSLWLRNRRRPNRYTPANITIASRSAIPLDLTNDGCRRLRDQQLAI